MCDLTEDEVLQAIRAANLGGNTIRVTFNSGPYDVVRSTRAADALALALAIVRKFCEINGLPVRDSTPGVTTCPTPAGGWCMREDCRKCHPKAAPARGGMASHQVPAEKAGEWLGNVLEQHFAGTVKPDLETTDPRPLSEADKSVYRSIADGYGVALPDGGSDAG